MLKRALVIMVTTSIVCSVILVPANSQRRRSAGSAKPLVDGPDLTVILDHPMDKTIKVKNIGTKPAGPSKLTLDCVRLESRMQMYSCPDLPIAKMQAYFDAGFPNNATIQVPSLAPGASFTHTLTFWDEMNWPKGTYRFTAVADAAHTVETNPRHNASVSTLIIP